MALEKFFVLLYEAIQEQSTEEDVEELSEEQKELVDTFGYDSIDFGLDFWKIESGVA